MSAGSNLAVVHHDLNACAPKFKDKVISALAECQSKGLDAIVYEALRTDELQQLYWSKGRELQGGVWVIVDADSVVTRIPHADHGWHFFGMAIDVISKSKEWSVTPEWRKEVSDIFKAHGLHWAGDWPHFKDLPHYQFTNQFNPSDNDRAAYARGGLTAVWRLNNAL